MAFPEANPALRDLCLQLLPHTAELGAQLATVIRAEIPMYAAGELVSHDALVVTSTDNLEYILANLAGIPGAAKATPAVTGAARAERGIPYDDVLQAFRIGGRFVWEQLVRHAAPAAKEQLLLAAADIWAVTDDLQAQVSRAYRVTMADRARRDANTRAALVDAVLDGANAGRLLWESVRDLNLPHTGEFVVVSAQSAAPGAEGLPDVERLLRAQNMDSAWRLDRAHQDGLVSLRPGARLAGLADVLASQATSRVGISRPFSRIPQAKHACEQARAAASAASPGSCEVVRYDDRPAAVLLARAPDSAAELARHVLGPVLQLPGEDSELLLHTARRWLECQGSTSAAAQRLHVHRNTVGYRLRRLHELTGLDLAHPLEAAQLHLALEAARVTGLA